MNSPNQSVAQLAEGLCCERLAVYFDAITSELALKVLGDEERKLFKIEFDTQSVTGRKSVDEITEVDYQPSHHAKRGRVELGKERSSDPNMDRYQSSLELCLWIRKRNIKQMKGVRNENDKENQDERTNSE